VRAMRLRGGQAILETVLALIFVTFAFLVVFQVAHMATARILLDHAAARAARAKSVGFNDWMCLKAARVAVIPVAGRRLWPRRMEDDAKDFALNERSIVPIYMADARNESEALGMLEYERWGTMDFKVESGLGNAAEASARVGIGVPRVYMPDGSDDVRLHGEAHMESHFPLYLNDQGR